MMFPDRATAFGDLKEEGLQRVFYIIRSEPGIARVEIAGRMMASPSTVTSITTELLAQGMIAEVAQPSDRGASKRGRPRIGLKVRGDSHLIAGLKIARDCISTIIVDFEGADLASAETPLSASVLDLPDLVAAVSRALADVCEVAGVTQDQISGVGIGLAGLIHAPSRVVHWSPSLIPRSVDLATPLEAALGCPVFLDNDANQVAKAEQLFGYGRGVRDFLVLTLEHGVGMGIVINDRIYRGARGCGAEFGHTKVQIGGALCQCGNRGCLEAYIGDYALLREAGEAGTEHPQQALGDLWRRAEAGDQVALAVFDRARDMFAMGLANVISLFDPEMIILAGRRASFDHLDAERVITEMESHVLQGAALLPTVQVHQWGDLMWAKGAAANAIEGISGQRIREIADLVS